MARVLRTLLALCAVIWVVAPAAAGAAKSEQFYVVSAHPDDEVAGWSFIESLPDSTYTVWVIFTRGEATDSCLPPDESEVYERGTEGPVEFGGHFADMTPREAGLAEHMKLESSSGPYKYEGPDSPVGEPDKAERHPFGYPWVGQRTEACAKARVASWHWFLDGMHATDGTGGDFGIAGDPWRAASYRGRICPQRKAKKRGRARKVGVGERVGGVTCAQVWANQDSARLVFEYADQGFADGVFEPTKFTSAEVTAAIAWLRTNRPRMGIPVLPETGLLNPISHADGVRCPSSGQGDHGIVADALRDVDHGAGPRSGLMACPDDPYGDGAEVSGYRDANPATMLLMNLVEPVTGRRIGPYLTAYGWLFPGYPLAGCIQSCSYWTVGG